jgi:quercetin dioxygenase-like cupin family protein
MPDEPSTVAAIASNMNYGEVTVVDQLQSLELESPGSDAAAVYDQPIGLRLLHMDPASGEEHYLIRYLAGVRGRAHRHTAAHTIVVIEGRLEANGRIIGPGAYAHFPAGVVLRHQATADGPCLFVILFHGKFDVQVVET